jgi:hypothetical protein
MTGWHGEQWDFKTMKRQWNILITESELDGKIVMPQHGHSNYY